MSHLEFCDRFTSSLFGPSGIQALSYLTDMRGLSIQTLKDLSVGYADFSTKSGLSFELHSRIVFPIKDLAGDIVGFGGRAMGNSQPKYLNSPASDTFVKSKLLYNLDIAGDYILDAGYAIVVEGYFDVASLWEYGIRNVVAVCGTSPSKWHIRLLKRYADSVHIAFDDDKAGIAATDRAIALSEAERFPVFSIAGMSGMDPDDYVQKFGKEKFLQLINAKETKIGKSQVN